MKGTAEGCGSPAARPDQSADGPAKPALCPPSVLHRAGEATGLAGFYGLNFASVDGRVVTKGGGRMSAFEIVHQDQVQGKLTCFDRMIFKGPCATGAHVVSGYVDRRARLMVT